jgi:hypothetical protein
MNAVQEVGRNAACPCGSGKKYKRGCGAKARGLSGRERIAVMVLIGAVLAAIVLGVASFNRDAGSTGPQRVWSEEHGHWHTVP